MDILPDSRRAVESIVLKIKANDLKGDLLSKPDCRIALYWKRPDEKKFQPLASTELIWNEKSPSYQQHVTVPWSMETGLVYRAAVFECDYYHKGPDDPHPKTTKNTHTPDHVNFWIYKSGGFVDFSIENLLSGPQTLPVMTKKNGQVGKSTLTIEALRFPASKRAITMRYSIKKFKRSSIFALVDKDDMYVCTVVHPNTPKEAVVHTTEIVWNSQSPKYKKFTLNYGLFDANLDTSFELRIFRMKSKQGVEEVGRTKPMNLGSMLIEPKKGAKHVFDAFDPEKMIKKGKLVDMCDIKLKQCTIVEDPAFNPALNCNPALIAQPPAQFAPFNRDFKKK